MKKLLLPLVLLASLAPVLAQQTPPPSTTDNTTAAGNATIAAAPDGEIITLEEFQITASSLKDSYVASEATAGTRTGDKILETPFTVQVLTEDFINDFQLFSDDDMLAYVAATTANTGAATRVRGFTALVTRDGFSNAMPATPTNTLQTEIIKGPLSTLYGRATPGGIVNKVSKRPNKRTILSATATYGTDDFMRFAASGTGPVLPSVFDKKLYYFAYYEYQHTETTEDFVKLDKQYAGLSLLYMFKPTTSLSFTIEFQPETSHENSGGVIYYENATFKPVSPTVAPFTLDTYSTVTRNWTGVGSFSSYGPDTSRECNYWGTNLLLEHRINPVWSFRTALQTYSKDTWKYRWDGASYLYQYETAPGSGTYDYTLSKRVPFAEDYFEDNIAAQADLLGRFKTRALTTIDHRVLLAADGFYYTRDRDVSKMKTEAVDADPELPFDSIYLNFNDPLYVNLPSKGKLSEHTVDYTLKKKTFGALASYRASLYRGRIAFMASGRYDYYQDNLYDYIDKVDSNGNSNSKLTYSTGLNYHILDDKFLVYTSISTGFLPQEAVDDGMLTLVPPEESSGFEFGFKGTTPNETLGYTVSFYKIKQKNVRYTNGDYLASRDSGKKQIPQYLTGLVEEAKGIDINFHVKPLPKLILTGALGLVDSENVSSNNTNALGKPMTYVGKWNASLVGRYTIDKGPIKGTVIGATTTYRDSCIASYATAAIPQQNIPSLILVNAFVSYGWKTGVIKHKLSLNAFNLLDKEYYYYSGRKARGLEGRLTYNISY